MPPGPPHRLARARPASDASPAASAAPADRAARLDALVRALGSQLRRGPAAGDASGAAPWPTGLTEVDALLGGGLPRAGLSEIAGPASSGRTSVALALVARATRAGHCAAWIDAADAFDPISADDAGAALERVLWARPRAGDETLRIAARLLETDGFPLVVLDLGLAPARGAVRDPNAWRRLARAAQAAARALVVLADERVAGSAADVALALARHPARWSEAPTLLEGLELEVALVRHRTAPAAAGRGVRVRTPRDERAA
ncbi:MAG: hypothetical protein R3E88_07255 [Myxococcota bacterium]